MRKLEMGKWSVNVDEVFILTLSENPTTGYRWELTVTEGLQILDGQYVGPDISMPGAGGKHVWRIKATSKGFNAICGIYRRSWEPITGSEQTVVCQIFVQ